jgi:branched-chain amino acid aminotransferase
MGILPAEAPAGFCVCLEEVPWPRPRPPSRLTTTQFRRPVMTDNVCNAKAGCLYPNNARMLAEAMRQGLRQRARGRCDGQRGRNATANVFMVRDGTAFTPIPNGTFLNGITRQRHIANLRAAGVEVVETVLTFEDFRKADEVFMTGNLNKVTPVVEFDGTHYQRGPIAEKARDLYWDWARSDAG